MKKISIQFAHNLLACVPATTKEKQEILARWKTNGFIGKRISTGKYSQNSHIHGHCQQIASETGNSLTVVKEWAKMAAISRGYPFEVFKNKVYPVSLAGVECSAAIIVIDVMHQLGAELNIRLIEE